MALAWLRWVPVDGLGIDAEDRRGGGGVDVVAFLEGLAHALVLREVGHDAQLDLAVVGGQQGPTRPARRAPAARRPRAGAGRARVRTGMFCRLGSLDDARRPVAAVTWLKEQWMRPVRSFDEARQGVHVGALELLNLAVLEDALGDRDLRRTSPRGWRGPWPSRSWCGLGRLTPASTWISKLLEQHLAQGLGAGARSG